METLIWMFLVAVLLGTGLTFMVRNQSLWPGGIWFLLGAALLAVALIGPFGESTPAAP